MLSMCRSYAQVGRRLAEQAVPRKYDAVVLPVNNGEPVLTSTVMTQVGAEAYKPLSTYDRF